MILSDYQNAKPQQVANNVELKHFNFLEGTRTFCDDILMGWGGHRANRLQFFTTDIVNLPITNHGGTKNFYKRTRNVSCLIGGIN